MHSITYEYALFLPNPSDGFKTQGLRDKRREVRKGEKLETMSQKRDHVTIP